MTDTEQQIIADIQQGLIQDGITYHGVTYPIKQHGGLRFAPRTLAKALGKFENYGFEEYAVDEIIAFYPDSHDFNNLTAEQLAEKFFAR